MANIYTTQVLKLAVYAGEIMMRSGAEIYRVEDTMTRICTACGIKNTEVFATTTGIFISLDSGNDEEGTHTYIKRINGSVTDLYKISRINDFSRRFANTDMTIDQAMGRLRAIDSKQPYPIGLRILGAAMAASFFSIIFGGNEIDAIIAAVAGIISYQIGLFISRYEVNFFIRGLVCTAIAAIIAMGATTFVSHASYQPIIIGTLMLYVPGVAITNSIRDFLSGDMQSGLSRMIEAIITAASLAVGSGTVIHFWHMIGGIIT